MVFRLSLVVRVEAVVAACAFVVAITVSLLRIAASFLGGRRRRLVVGEGDVKGVDSSRLQ